MDISVLKTEIDTDPLGRGYTGMTIKQVVIDINTVNRTSNKATMQATEVLNAIDKTEFNAKTNAQKQQVWDILHLGTVNPFGLEADLLVDIFGGGSTTITSLQTLRKNNISRAEELGLGKVREGHVLEVRS